MKFSLHDLKNVNTALGLLYDKDGNYRPGFKPEEFYNTILLDSLKYGEENYVHLKYAETVNIRKGEKVARFRRWAGMTPTIRPMIEGLPPAPDKHAYEYMEVGNVFSFGRWSEYTDQIDMSHVSEIVAERSVQYGENANQTKELYARKTWLSAPNEFYANFKNGFADLCFGDAVTIDDLRFLTARMKRMQVKPISGKFNYICSPEFINGLIDDPRVKMYMQINQTTGNLWTSGECFPLFDLNFIPTMLDEFAYPDVEFPGVYEKSDGHEVIRLYAIKDSTLYYLDVEDDVVVDAAGHTARLVAEGVTYLNDGTAVENAIKWELPTAASDVSVVTGKLHESTIDSTHIKAQKSTITHSADTYGVMKTQFGAPESAASDGTAIGKLLKSGAFMQLPVHRGILFGDEAMIKLNYEGLSDAPRIIIKALGSSGVLDPLDQRQSVGYRVDGFGLAIKRPEAICITYGIPANAEFAALTSAYVMSASKGVLEYEGEWINKDGNNVQGMVVDAVNNPYGQPTATALVDAYNRYKPLTYSVHNVGDLVTFKGVPYVVTEQFGYNVAGELAVGRSLSSGQYFTSYGKLYKALATINPEDVDEQTAGIIVEESEAELTQASLEAFFQANKSNLKKDYDRLFANLVDTANDPDSNVR